MAKINSFVITKIETTNKREFIVTVLVNSLKESFVINTPITGSVSLPDNLEILLLNKDFNQMRNFMKFLSDYLKGSNLSLPFDIIAQRKITPAEIQTT